MPDEELALNPPKAPEVPPTVMPLRARQLRLPTTFSALRHRNFQLYFVGQLVSVAGTWMQIIAQSWLVYQLSRSELTLGIVGFAAAIPALIVSPWGGVVVDRVPRRSLLIVTQTVAMLLAFVLAALTFADMVRVWHVVVLAVILGGVNSFDGPARQAFVVDMVGHEDLTNAIALNSMVFNGARVIGPAIGGMLLAAFGASWCFLINGLSFLAVIGVLLIMQVPRHPHAHALAGPWGQLTSGLRYVKERTDMLGLLLISLIFSVFGISYWTVLPAFVDKVLGQEALAYGTIQAVSGLGAITGAFIMARWGSDLPRGRILAVTGMLFPVALLIFANTASYPLALALSLLLGLGFMLVFVILNTLLQLNVADEMRGRVLSLYTLTFFGFAPFGNLALGSLSEVWGIGPAVSLSAGIAALFTVIVLLAIPRVARLR